MTQGVRIEAAANAAQIEAAAHLFDEPARPDAVARFLGEENHHLLIAYDRERPVGFVTGVEMTHPDKGTEMFLYELAVDEVARRTGVGTALVDALATLAREKGCYDMWVLTDDNNEAAVRTYRGAGGAAPSSHILIEWALDA
jgi:[ribosomal protein S18]-alanine N-acetyltransferase